MNRRVLICMVLTTLAGISCGCGGGAVKRTTTLAPQVKPVIKDATEEELLSKYNQIADGIRSVDATVQLRATAGSKYSGVIDEYHEVKAFLLAQRPEEIRVIGQAPVIGTTVFDMASDSENFWVSIPSKNKFIEGPVKLERVSSKPIENLRPQHLADALLWPSVRKEESVLFEEFNDETARFYVLTVLRGGYRMEALRTIWFNRTDLQISRLQTYGAKGVLLSDVKVGDWELVTDQERPAGSPPDATVAFPRTIRLERPHDDYQLDLQISKLMLNEQLPPDRFRLAQPAGSELVRVGDNGTEKPQ